MIARLMARVYRCLGILSKGQLVEVDRGGLVAGYVGQTAIKTGEVLQKAMGGVLFIDEAYTLTDRGAQRLRAGSRSHTLLKAMEGSSGGPGGDRGPATLNPWSGSSIPTRGLESRFTPCFFGISRIIQHKSWQRSLNCAAKEAGTHWQTTQGPSFCACWNRDAAIPEALAMRAAYEICLNER